MNNKKLARELVRLAKELTENEPKKAALSRKYYTEIGKILKEHAKDNEELVSAFVSMFEQDNPNFDSSRFTKFVQV